MLQYFKEKVLCPQRHCTDTIRTCAAAPTGSLGGKVAGGAAVGEDIWPGEWMGDYMNECKDGQMDNSPSI